MNVYLQVNTSGEDSKSGLSPNVEDGKEGEESLLQVAKHIQDSCPHLVLQGLMTIGAIASSHQAKQGEENPDFTTLKSARDMLQNKLNLKELKLSMGMSDDFKAAIEAGSDSIR